MMFRMFGLCLFLLTGGVVCADQLVGKVVGVSDGDTITVLDSSKTQYKIRLAEIDTPEKKQAFGMQAKKALSSRVFGKIVVVEYDKKDRYGRIVGKIMLDKRWINMEMIATGYAWHYKTYSKDVTLAKAEKEARSKKLGLWVDSNPIAPWEFRRAKKRSANTSSNIKTVSYQGKEQGYWLNTSSGTRHNGSCKYFKNTKRGESCGSADGKSCGTCGG